MKSTPPIPIFAKLARLSLATSAGFIFVATLGAQTAATGTIEGRVFDLRRGEYVEKARITLEETKQEVLTDSSGQYRLDNVPAGSVKLDVFYTGMGSHTELVTVASGQTVQHDITFADPGKPRAADPTVKMDDFVVSTSKEMDGAMIAINEQRFASSIMNVVSTDEFGAVAEGNVAEFLKFLPGVNVDSTGGNARAISINGVPSNNVPVTIDGFSLASAGGDGNTGRTVEVDMVSINNLSRIEVGYSPTPESPGSALAGSVNLVPRSAFERARPVFNSSVYIMMRDDERSFRRTPGPRAQSSYKVHPGFDFSYIAPVNKRFGFTLSAGTSSQYTGEPNSTNTWRGGGTATNGNAFPHTTPDKPYLSSYAVRGGGKPTRRNSFGLTLDYKLTPYDRLSFAFQISTFDVEIAHDTLTFNVNRVLPGDFTVTSTHGAVGAGDMQVVTQERERNNRTYMPTFVWRHDGPVWKAVAGAGLSHGVNRFRDIDHGHFANSTSRRTGVTVSFDDIFYLRPNRITVTDGASGAPVDPYSLGSYAVNSVNSLQSDGSDTQQTAYASLRRDFQWRVPVTLKGGLDLRHSERDLRGGTPPYTFVGADGRASTTPIGSDDSAAPFLAASVSQRVVAFGFPPIGWVSNQQLWDFYQSHPTSFTLNPDSQYRSEVTVSKHADEVISAAYLRGDVQFFDRRLKLVGGVRAEQTNIKAAGPLTDPTRNFRRDAGGGIILGADGRPVPIATNALATSMLTYLDRGQQTRKEYLRLFPNLNASFNVRDNLIARAAYYYSVGRPDFDQYAAGLTLPDTAQAPSTSNLIQVNNAGIKAWSAKTTSVRLEYYFAGVGQISVGAFRRDFKNFFGGTVFNATPEFLGLYGLDPTLYGDYDVATQENLTGTFRMEGLDFNYKQALTFLPRWARGVQVFINGSSQRATGPNQERFTDANITPRSGNWGVSLTREKYNVRMNWNYRGRQRMGLVAAGPSIGPGTYRWNSKRLSLDLLGEYYFYKRIALFANLRNIGDATEDSEIAGPSTPPVAQFRQRIDFGSLWTFGIKGTF